MEIDRLLIYTILIAVFSSQKGLRDTAIICFYNGIYLVDYRMILIAYSSVLFPVPSRLFSTSLLTRYTRSESCTCTYLVPSPESLPR